MTDGPSELVNPPLCDIVRLPAIEAVRDNVGLCRTIDRRDTAGLSAGLSQTTEPRDVLGLPSDVLGRANEPVRGGRRTIGLDAG